MKTDHPSNRPSPSNSRYGSPMGNGKMLRKTSTGPSPIQVFPLVLLVCWSLILGNATIYSNLTKKATKTVAGNNARSHFWRILNRKYQPKTYSNI